MHNITKRQASTRGHFHLGLVSGTMTKSTEVTRFSLLLDYGFILASYPRTVLP